MALSVPVVIASDQSVISIDLSTVGGDGMSLGQRWLLQQSQLFPPVT